VITRLIAGAGGVALRGALALDTKAFNVTILTADGGDLIPQARGAGRDVGLLRHMRPEIDPLEDLRAIRELSGWLGEGRFDLVHTHSSKAGALGRIAARQVHVPAVHTFHGFPFHPFQSFIRRKAYVAVERRLGRITDAFLATGSAVAAEAVRLGIAPPERIRAIGSAIGPGFHPRTEDAIAEARRRMDIPAGVRVVGTVGRLDHQKAPLDLVAALSRLRREDVSFVWVGDGPLRRRVEEAVSAAGLDSRFLLLGERRDVAALLPGFDLFALPSLYEGLPRSIVEAMSCNVPVVATAVNAVPELVVPGRTGLLVAPANPASMASAIAHLLDHPAEASRMSGAAMAALGDRFLETTLGRDIEETYLSVLARAGRYGATTGREDERPPRADLEDEGKETGEPARAESA